MLTYGLVSSPRGFILVSPNGELIARAARAPAALSAMLASRAPPLRLVVAERTLRELPEPFAAILRHHPLVIAPDGLLDAIHASAALRTSSRRSAALLARLPFLSWFHCDLRTLMPTSDRQIELF
jgi:hypothetical protein